MNSEATASVTVTLVTLLLEVVSLIFNSVSSDFIFKDNSSCCFFSWASSAFLSTVLLQETAINKSAVTIVSSEWAANSVIADYKCGQKKLFTFPFGANFEKLPSTTELSYQVPKNWKLLFVGVYWDTKGGEYAYNCFKILFDKGYDVELTVLGCHPPSEFKHPKVNVISFIDKNSDEGQIKLSNIFKEHHLLSRSGC